MLLVQRWHENDRRISLKYGHIHTDKALIYQHGGTVTDRKAMTRHIPPVSLSQPGGRSVFPMGRRFADTDALITSTNRNINQKAG